MNSIVIGVNGYSKKAAALKEIRIPLLLSTDAGTGKNGYRAGFFYPR